MQEMFLCVLVLLVLMAVAAGSLSQQQLASFSQQHLETVLFPSSFALKWRKKRDHIRMLYYVRDKPWTDTDTSDEDEAKEQSLVEKEPESNAETVPESVLLDEIEDLEDDLDVEVEEEDEDVVTVEKDGPGGEDDDGSPEPDSVDDIEEIDLDDTDSTSGDVSEGDAVSATSAEEQLNESRGLQALWKDFIHMPSPVDLADLTAEQRLAALRANNTDKDALYRQLVSQFDDPLATGGRRALWLDQEFALNLKGLAVLAVHPHLTQSFGESISKKLARGLKLLSSSQKAASGGPNGLYFLHQLVVKALAASLQAHVIHLNHKVIEKVVDLAEQRHVSKRPITKGLVLNALFDMLQHDANPSVILLNDNLDWLLNNQAASQAVLAEFRKVESRLLFIAVEPSDDIKAGHTLASIGSSVDANKVETPSEEQQAMQQNNSPQPPSSMMSSFFGGPPPPGMSMGTGFGLPLPPPPPGFFAPMTRGFQVVIKNGTVNMIPLPPNAMPPGSMPFNPEVMKKVMEEHQKRFNVSQPQTNMMNGFLSDMPRISFPMFPPDMSDEEVQDFMQDPENQAKIKGMIDSVMQSVMHQLSQQPGPMPTHIEVNVQMIPPPQQAAKNQAKPTSAPPSPSDLAKPQPASGGTRSKRSTDAKKFKDDSSVMSVAGKTVANLFEELLIEAPRDHQLKVLWDRFIEEEVSSRIIRINRRLLQQELRKNNIRYNGDVLFQLDEVLRRQVLSRELVKDAIFAALKLQAGKFSLIATVKKSASTAEEVSKGIEDSPVTEEMVSSAATSKLDSLELSLWALDTAIGGIVKVPTPRLGRPAARSKEEIESLALDKHEKALVGNVISPQDIGVTYDMIGGLEEVKENLRQAITYPLKYPRLYQEGVASEAVKGVLLFGPPGTGKTMLAKAVATEGGATFLSVDASTIENKWLGESEKNAKAVFTLARKLAPCVIYLDEVDSILSSREHGDESSHGTLTSVKTTLMQEWDGLRTTKDRVVVIASTNRPFDLDEAVLRRLPRRIIVDLPDLVTRKEILSVTLANNRISTEVDLQQLAEQLEGYTGSDIKEVCREAVVRVSHERAHAIEIGRSGKLDPQDTTTNTFNEVDPFDVNIPLRPVTMKDFQIAMKKLKASINDNGRELQKVVEWNEKYGEYKRSRKKSSSTLNLYV